MFKESIKSNTVVKVTTREEVDNLCDWLESEGVGTKWSTDNRLVVLDNKVIIPCDDNNMLISGYSGYRTITYQEALKENTKTMNKEKALKELEEIKARTAELERIINEPEIEYYEVETPVSYNGDILFNDNKQLLKVEGGLYNVIGNSRPYDVYKEAYVWMPCKREDLKVGDTAYRTDREIKDFTERSGACKILDRSKHLYTNSNEDLIMSGTTWTYWYKLVRREELGL